MNLYYFKFLFYEFILFSLIIIVNYLFDGYFQHPFTRVDLIAGVIFLPVLVCLLFVLTKLFKRFNAISVRNKIILSIPTFIITVFVIGIILSRVGL